MQTDARPQAVTSAMTWHRLLRWSAVGIVILLLCAVGGFRDPEAAGFTLATIAGLLLLRFRTGILGELVLAVLFADIAAWMLPGGVSNLTHHENWVASALPSSLAAVALGGLIAAVASLAGRRRATSAGGRTPLVVAIAVVVLVAAANIAGAAGDQNGPVPAGPYDLSVTARHVQFVERHLEAHAGRIGVVVSNFDLFWHTFTIRKLLVNLDVPVQADRRIEFDAPPGTYEFICAIPGHAQAGMKGTLTVR